MVGTFSLSEPTIDPLKGALEGRQGTSVMYLPYPSRDLSVSTHFDGRGTGCPRDPGCQCMMPPCPQSAVPQVCSAILMGPPWTLVVADQLLTSAGPISVPHGRSSDEQRGIASVFSWGTYVCPRFEFRVPRSLLLRPSFLAPAPVRTASRIWTGWCPSSAASTVFGVGRRTLDPTYSAGILHLWMANSGACLNGPPESAMRITAVSLGSIA
jgi:hypothetical protein|mmetsp:Transcript_61618/g.102272  ORF Transcript_61618/g.102272 Transcript_61618/m.102272 type:complete len:211 (-) Transcript_61618:220-852(-)